MTLPLGPEQSSLKVGPRRPMPFPESGKRVQLITCPHCRAKGLLWFYAPYEHGYPTACIKCGARAVIKQKDVSLGEIQRAGGFTPRMQGVRESQRWGLDATGFYDTQRDIHSLGYRRAYKAGYIPAPIDANLR